MADILVGEEAAKGIRGHEDGNSPPRHREHGVLGIGLHGDVGALII
jgi:hypothetical protein